MNHYIQILSFPCSEHKSFCCLWNFVFKQLEGDAAQGLAISRDVEEHGADHGCRKWWQGTVAFVLLQVLDLYSCLSGTPPLWGFGKLNWDALTCGCFLILGFWDTWALDNRFFSQDDTQLFSEAYSLTHSAGGDRVSQNPKLDLRLIGVVGLSWA